MFIRVGLRSLNNKVEFFEVKESRVRVRVQIASSGLGGLPLGCWGAQMAAKPWVLGSPVTVSPERPRAPRDPNCWLEFAE